MDHTILFEMYSRSLDEILIDMQHRGADEIEMGNFVVANLTEYRPFDEITEEEVEEYLEALLFGEV